jgi:hypothetical protein
MDIQWLNNTHFQHWPVLNAEWIGDFDTKLNRYAMLCIAFYLHNLAMMKCNTEVFIALPVS